MEFNTCTFYKINSKWITNVNINAETIKLLKWIQFFKMAIANASFLFC